MFLKLDSYSPEDHRDPISLQSFFFLLQDVLEDSGGFLRQFLVDDKVITHPLLPTLPPTNHPLSRRLGGWQGFIPLTHHINPLSHTLSHPLSPGMCGDCHVGGPLLHVCQRLFPWFVLCCRYESTSQTYPASVFHRPDHGQRVLRERRVGESKRLCGYRGYRQPCCATNGQGNLTGPY